MFWNRSIVSDDLLGWIRDNFDWVEENQPDWWSSAPLVTPTKDFFSANRGDDQATAEAVIRDISAILNLQTKVRLEALPELPDELKHQYGVLGETVGEYWHDEDEPLITYRPSLLRQPVLFINTMAHELIHARLAPFVDDLPGGIEAHELATDLHCIIAGFGVIQLEAAEQAGWTGYMSQPSRAIALAEFLKRKGIGTDLARRHLSSRPARWLKKALTQVNQAQ